MPKGIKTSAKAFIAVKATIVATAVTFIIIFMIITTIIAVVIAEICINAKAENEWAFEHVLKMTGFDKTNSNERFEITRVYSESAYPYYVMYITYNGEPEDFIRESIALCDDMYQNVDRCDEYSFSVKCGELAFVCDRSRYVETNVLFDYSSLECFDLNSLTVHTNGMTDEDIHNIESGNYSFEVYLK